MIRIVPKDVNVDFIVLMRRAYIGSLVVMALAAMLLFFGKSLGMGPKLGIDFAGGTEIQVKMDPSIGIEHIRSGLSSLGLSDDSVQTFGSASDHSYLVRVQSVYFGSEAKKDRLVAALEKHYGAEAWKEFRFDPDEGMSFIAIANDALGAREIQRTLESDPELEELLGQWYRPDGSQGSEDPQDEELGDDDSAFDGDADPVDAEEQGDDDSAADDEVADQGADDEEADDEDLSEQDWVTITSSEINAYVVQLPGLLDEVNQTLAKAFGEDMFEVQRVDSIGPKVGAELRRKGTSAVLISLALILVYIAFRFDLAFSPGAVAALIHDVLITMGVFVLLGMEFNISIIGALLTIVGYSLNDTIVVYDRIRENLTRYKRRKLDWIVNLSINETLSRTFMTSITTAVVVGCMVVFGGPIIKPFSVALLTGVIVGTYSSIFIASPLILVTQPWLPVDTNKD
jgi:preprotein translocase SecF subunit